MTTNALLYGQDRLDALEHAREITALTIFRPWATTPDEPLIIELDQSLLVRLGWHVGDHLTLVPIDLDRTTRGGSLVIRKARRGEPAIALPPFAQGPGEFDEYRIPLVLRTPIGPRFEWPFPEHWVETFFPLQYESGPHDFLPIDRSWSLADLLDQQGEVILSLDSSYLHLVLQRTSPDPTTLDIHFIPGMLHLMGWSPATSLILESASDFDPDAKSDVLTIRRTKSTETPTLTWDGRKLKVPVPSPWLKRLLPRHYHPSLADESPELEEWFELSDSALENPDTTVVRFKALKVSGDAISFEITLPANPF